MEIIIYAISIFFGLLVFLWVIAALSQRFCGAIYRALDRWADRKTLRNY